MADPLSILIGGRSQAGQQRDAQVAQASAQQNTPNPASVPTQAQPTQPPATNSAGMPTFMASAATAPPSGSNLAQTTGGSTTNQRNTLLGQG